MKAPHLNRLLVLEAPEKLADGSGGFTETWAALGNHWAEVSARSGARAIHCWRAGVAGQLSNSRAGRTAGVFDAPRAGSAVPRGRTPVRDPRCRRS